MKNKLEKFVLPAIILGVLLRVILSVITYHPDITAYTTSGQFILQGHIFDLYDQAIRIAQEGIISLSPGNFNFAYQPLAYFIPAFFYLPFKPLVLQTAPKLFHVDPIVWTGPTLRYYLPLLIYKLPLILADLGIIWLLPRLFNQQKNKQLSKIIWALNPIAIYVSSMIGQIDAVLVFFLVAALVSIKQKQFVYASLLLALSALTKPIALILIPLLAIYVWQKKSFKKSLPVWLAGFSLFFLVIAPFLSSVAYKHYVLGGHHMLKSIYAGIQIAPATTIPWFFIFYALSALLVIKQRQSLLKTLGLAVFSSLAFTHFHPQWFLWISPWLVYLAVKKSSFLIPALTSLAWVVILFSFEPSLHLGIFFGLNLSTPSFPQLVSNNLSNLVLLARAWLIVVLITQFLPFADEKAT